MCENLRQDNRQFPRIDKDVPINITRVVWPVPRTPEATGQGVNISAGGICLAAPVAYRPGEVLSLEINLPGLVDHKKPHSLFVDASSVPPLTAVGEVVWCRDCGDGASWEIGLRFVDIYEDDRNTLNRYLEATAGTGS
ncbi:MAG: PilZ domain-containing protein [Desulfatibacillaceae bacterium]